MQDKRCVVLLVEDDPEIRAPFRGLLEHAGFSVREATDGLQAIGMFQVHAVDAIVIDLVLPRLDGITTIITLRHTLHGQQVPIIVVTALNDSQSAQSARQAGANEVLFKPIRPYQLMEALNKYLSPHAAEWGRLHQLMQD